jgi:hypothetical protein
MAVFEGTLDENQRCPITEACIRGLECLEVNGNAAVCLRAPRAGDPCLGGGVCAREHFCRDSVCHFWGRIGSPCEVFDDGWDSCRDGLHCGGDDVCVLDLDDGDACNHDQQCHSGVCGDAGECVGGWEPVNYCDPGSFHPPA